MSTNGYHIQHYGVGPRVVVKDGFKSVGSLPAMPGMILTDGSVIVSTGKHPWRITVRHPKWGRHTLLTMESVTLRSARKHGFAK